MSIDITANYCDARKYVLAYRGIIPEALYEDLMSMTDAHLGQLFPYSNHGLTRGDVLTETDTSFNRPILMQLVRKYKSMEVRSDRIRREAERAAYLSTCPPLYVRVIRAIRQFLHDLNKSTRPS